MLMMIVNPTAGSGRPVAAAEGVCRLLDEYAIPWRLEKTRFAGHATELARQAAVNGYDGIVGVGGDGTLSEIVNGLTQRPLPLYLVPCGTGNDFARFLKLPSDPVEAMRAQLNSSKGGALDIGLVNGKAFLNVAGTGFDVEVLRQTARFKRLGRGLVPYLLGVCAALRHFKPLEAELTLEDGSTIRESLTIIAFANGQYIGGGMRVAPRADPADGMLDVVSVRRVPRFLIALLLPTFITGSFIRLPVSTVRRCRHIVLRSQGMTLQLDGELHDMDCADIRLLPGHLPVSLPNAALATERKQA